MEMKIMKHTPHSDTNYCNLETLPDAFTSKILASCARRLVVRSEPADAGEVETTKQNRSGMKVEKRFAQSHPN